MVTRATQTPEYWKAFSLDATDADLIYSTISESGKPQSSAALASIVIQRRVDVENAAIRRDFGRTSVYQPKKHFANGEEVMFPSLGFALGVVGTQRKGNNTSVGEFDVIQVRFRDGVQREFAAGYLGENRLNDDSVIQLLMAAADGGDSAEQVAEKFAALVVPSVDRILSTRQEFVKLGPDWFLRELMTSVSEGHLNLAEAVLEVAHGGPLSAKAILNELRLPADVAATLQEVSLNSALGIDPRFDEVSISDEPAWFLRRLQPAEVRELPAALRDPLSLPGEVDETHDQIARNIDDELEVALNPPIEPAQKNGVVLTFQHRRAGTLGWGRKIGSVLTDFEKKRLPVTFKDRANGKSFTVWLVKQGSYIWGLADWYKANDVPAGAEIEISRTDNAGTYLIDTKRHKPRREWVRSATVRNNKLHLETAQKPTTCQVEDLLAVFVDEQRLYEGYRSNSRDLIGIVKELFPEIAKLSPQGNVNARTLYAVVNVITRAAPREVFKALANAGAFSQVGDGYWHLADK